jgi:hypothetical protein
LYGEHIRWEFEARLKKIIILKAKNYIMYDGKKIKTKGSSIRDQKKEIAIREFIDKLIEMLVNDVPYPELTELYHTYIKEAMAVQDIKRWCSKKTLTEKIETSERANETKVKAAVAGSEYVESDKVFLFFKEDESLCLAENFTGDYNKERLLEKLFKSTQVFKAVLPTAELFNNYKLKKHKGKLAEILLASYTET